MSARGWLGDSIAGLMTTAVRQRDEALEGLRAMEEYTGLVVRERDELLARVQGLEALVRRQAIALDNRPLASLQHDTHTALRAGRV